MLGQLYIICLQYAQIWEVWMRIAKVGRYQNYLNLCKGGLLKNSKTAKTSQENLEYEDTKLLNLKQKDRIQLADTVKKIFYLYWYQAKNLWLLSTYSCENCKKKKRISRCQKTTLQTTNVLFDSEKNLNESIFFWIDSLKCLTW